MNKRYLDNASVVSEIEKGETTMASVKSNPPTETNTCTDIIDG
jgi:hypothetical protein